MSADTVEHQATVEKGLRMKIKRKTPAAAAAMTTASTVGKNGGNSDSKTKNLTATDDKCRSYEADEQQQQQQQQTELLSEVDQVIAEVAAQSSTDNKVKKKLNRNGSKCQRVDRRTKEGKNCPVAGGKDGKVAKDADGRKVDGKSTSSRKRTSLQVNNSVESNGKVQTTRSTDKEIIGVKTESNDSTKSLSACVLETSGTAVATDTNTGQLHIAIPHNKSFDPYEFVSKTEDVVVSPIKKFKSEKLESCSSDASSGGKSDVSTLTSSMCVMTDPDCLGPCEPGTSIVLEGIVWSESNNGLLVVNVTWRGKTYVGTLMDATKHHWASPRFQDDAATADLDWRSPKSKRNCATPVTEVSEGRRLRKCRRGQRSTTGSAAPSPHNETCTARGRKTRAADHQNHQQLQTAVESETAATSLREQSVDEEKLLECSGPNCNKKYKHINGLRYHQSHAHRNNSATTATSAKSSDSQSEKSCTCDGSVVEATPTTDHLPCHDDVGTVLASGITADLSRPSVAIVGCTATSADHTTGENISSNLAKVDTPPPTPTETSTVELLKAQSGNRTVDSSAGQLGVLLSCDTTAVSADQQQTVALLNNNSSAVDYRNTESGLLATNGSIHHPPGTTTAAANYENVQVKSEVLPDGEQQSNKEPPHVSEQHSRVSSASAVDVFRASSTVAESNSAPRTNQVAKHERTEESNKRSYLQAFKNSLHCDQQQQQQQQQHVDSDRRTVKVETEPSNRHRSSPRDIPPVFSGSTRLSAGPQFNAELTEATRDLLYRRQMEDMMRLQGLQGGPGSAAAAAAAVAAEDFNRMATAAAYGYGVDPALQAHLMAATNPEYRMHYERWMMEQQRFHVQQQLAAAMNSNVTGSKPVDMSSKTSSNNQHPSDRPLSPNSRSRVTSHTAKVSFEEGRHMSPQLSPRDKGLKDASRDRGNDRGKDGLVRRPTDFPTDRLTSSGQPTVAGKGPNWSDNLSSPSTPKVKPPTLSAGPIPTSGFPSSVFPVPLPPTKTGSRPLGLDISPYPPSMLAGFPVGNTPPHQLPPFFDSTPPSFLDLEAGQFKDRRPAQQDSRPKSRQSSPPSEKTSSSSAAWMSNNKDKSLLTDGVDKLPLAGDGRLAAGWNEKLATSVSTAQQQHSGSPLTLRHLHTHHHTHVVQGPAGYPLYGLIPPVPVAPALSVPQPFIPK